jgi:hypothetical protein
MKAKTDDTFERSLRSSLFCNAPWHSFGRITSLGLGLYLGVLGRRPSEFLTNLWSVYWCALVHSLKPQYVPSKHPLPNHIRAYPGFDSFDSLIYQITNGNFENLTAFPRISFEFTKGSQICCMPVITCKSIDSGVWDSALSTPPSLPGPPRAS